MTIFEDEAILRKTAVIRIRSSNISNTNFEQVTPLYTGILNLSGDSDAALTTAVQNVQSILFNDRYKALDASGTGNDDIDIVKCNFTPPNNTDQNELYKALIDFGVNQHACCIGVSMPYDVSNQTHLSLLISRLVQVGTLMDGSRPFLQFLKNAVLLTEGQEIHIYLRNLLERCTGKNVPKINSPKINQQQINVSNGGINYMQRIYRPPTSQHKKELIAKLRQHAGLGIACQDLLKDINRHWVNRLLNSLQMRQSDHISVPLIIQIFPAPQDGVLLTGESPFLHVLFNLKTIFEGTDIAQYCDEIYAYCTEP